MNEKTFFKLVIAVLVLLNLGTLGFLWMQKKNGPPGGPGGDVVGFLTHELGLSPAQQNALVILRDDFRQKSRDVHEHLHTLHTPFFNLLKGDNPDTAQLRVVVDSMTVYHRQMEQLTFEQFKAIRGLCTPQQQKRFDEIIDETLRFIAPPPPGRP